MQTIVLTGGAGFIGSSVCEKLVEQNNTVIVVDNFNSYYNPSYKRDNIAEIRKNMEEKRLSQERLKIEECDICDLGELKRVFSVHKVDGVIHLAACAGVRPSILEPDLYTRVNVQGTVNVLECLRQFDVKSFVFASSSSVYGNNKRVPFREEDVVDFPISPYAATKKAGELLCHTYHHLYRIKTACLRFFTVYGPRQRPDLAIYKFTDLILRGEELPFYGDGSTRRDYTYIDDIVEGVLRSLSWTMDLTQGGYEVFNLGESQTISLSEMVSTIERELGKKAVLKQLPLQPGDVTATYADVEKAKRILGYHPTTDFSTGIHQFVRWFLDKRREERQGI